MLYHKWKVWTLRYVNAHTDGCFLSNRNAIESAVDIPSASDSASDVVGDQTSLGFLSPRAASTAQKVKHNERLFISNKVSKSESGGRLSSFVSADVESSESAVEFARVSSQVDISTADSSSSGVAHVSDDKGVFKRCTLFEVYHVDGQSSSVDLLAALTDATNQSDYAAVQEIIQLLTVAVRANIGHYVKAEAEKAVDSIEVKGFKKELEDRW